MITLPAALDAKRELGPAWASWLNGLPRLASTMLDEWSLSSDGDPAHGETALVLPVRDAERTPLMLKLAFVEDDNAGEIPALKAWRGLGAVRLERADPRRGALLLERLSPRDLGAVAPRDAAEVVGRLYRRLHIPAPPTVHDLNPFVNRWLDSLESLGRSLPAPPRFVEQALHAGRALASGDQRQIVHGDLHPQNVLAGRREPWLVIDPKGFAGDPCYEPAPMLWNRWTEVLASGDVGGTIRERFYDLVDAAGYDERRCRDWGRRARDDQRRLRGRGRRPRRPSPRAAPARLDHPQHHRREGHAGRGGRRLVNRFADAGARSRRRPFSVAR